LKIVEVGIFVLVAQQVDYTDYPVMLELQRVIIQLLLLTTGDQLLIM